MLPDGAISTEHIWKRFRADFQRMLGRDRIARVLHPRRSQGWRWALRDVSLVVEPGAAIGLVGNNGSGKTTMLKIVAKVMHPYAGRVDVHGRIGALIEVKAGIHPDLSGRENIALQGSLLGLRRKEVMRRFDEIVAFAELEDAIDRQLKFYSSGMWTRLGFAIAAFLEPDILLVDEVLAVGDASFQQKCLDRMRTVLGKGTTVVFVSHDLAAVEALCSRVIWLRQGLVEHDGPARETLTEYRRVIEEAAEYLAEGEGIVRLVKAEVVPAEGHLVKTQGAMDIRVVVDSPERAQRDLLRGRERGPRDTDLRAVERHTPGGRRDRDPVLGGAAPAAAGAVLRVGGRVRDRHRLRAPLLASGGALRCRRPEPRRGAARRGAPRPGARRGVMGGEPAVRTAYLLRFDDLCPTMDLERWEPVERLLVDADVRPILAIVPDNRDPHLEVASEDDGFWERARGWAARGWTVAVHGYRHATVTDQPGMLRLHDRSEFAGLTLEEQTSKLRTAMEIFEREGLRPEVFVAPNHSFDPATLRAARTVGIDAVSDGFGVVPYVDREGMLWIPQQLWRFRTAPPGVWTVCSHTNAWDPARLAAFRRGLMANRRRVVDLAWVRRTHGRRRRPWWDAAAGSALAAATRAKVRRHSNTGPDVAVVT